VELGKRWNNYGLILKNQILNSFHRCSTIFQFGGTKVALTLEFHRNWGLLGTTVEQKINNKSIT
jgi:hypothetical protein